MKRPLQMTLLNYFGVEVSYSSAGLSQGQCESGPNTRHALCCFSDVEGNPRELHPT